MAITLSEEVRARLDAHLDAVERALLAAGSSRERRRGVVDDLEAQILEMLGSRAEVPTVSDLEGVLAGLDPPEAYAQQGGLGGEAGASRPSPRPLPPPPPSVGAAPSAPVAAEQRYSRVAIAGFVCILVSLLALLPMGIMAMFFTTRVETLRANAVVTNADMIVKAQAVAAARGGRRNGEGTTRRNEFEPVLEVPEKVVDEKVAREIVQNMVRAAPAIAMTKESSWSGSLCFLLPLLPFGLAGTVLGWIAFFQIRASGRRLRGTGLALFDGLFYPLLGLVIVGAISA